LHKQLLAICCSLLLVQSAFAETPEEASQRLERLKRDISQLASKVEDRLGDKKLLQRDLRDDEKQIAEIAAQKREIEAKIANLNSRVGSLNGEQKQLQKSLAREKTLLIKLVREEYQQGRQPRLKMLLSSEDPLATDRMLRYYDHFSGVLASRLKDYQQLLARFDSNQAELTQSESQLQEERAALQKREEQLREAYQKRLATLDSIDQSIGSEKSKIDKLQQDQKQLEQLIVELEASLANNLIDVDAPDITTRKGKLSWPIKGRLELNYGSQKSTLSKDGIFISADSGKSVKVVHPGRVVFAEWLRGYGLLIIVDHGGGYLSLYGHNQSLLRNTGDWVIAGDPIALTGDSGGYDKSGLYFSLRRDGKSFNPIPWLAKQK